MTNGLPRAKLSHQQTNHSAEFVKDRFLLTLFLVVSFDAFYGVRGPGSRAGAVDVAPLSGLPIS